MYGALTKRQMEFYDTKKEILDLLPFAYMEDNGTAVWYEGTVQALLRLVSFLADDSREENE